MGPIIRKSNLNICFLKLCRFVLGDLEFILSELKPSILLIVQMLWTGRSAQQLGCQRAAAEHLWGCSLLSLLALASC